MGTRWPMLSVIACGLAAALSACNGGGGGGSEPAPLSLSCYHDWTEYLRRPADIIRPIQSGQLSGPGETQDVPLFHDCQRFVKGSQYGAFFAIFATLRVRDLVSLDTRSAIPVAQIIAGEDYLPLSIQVGLNCVYMFMSGSSRVARIVGSGVAERNCLTNVPVDSIRTAPALEVRISSTADGPLSDADVPPVARWDLDERNGHYYFGLKCGPAWCEVGATGFASSPSVMERLHAVGLSSSVATGLRKHYAVKAWYDEQFLAVMSAGQAIPSLIRGIVVPDADLGSRDSSAYTNQWAPVARVLLDTTKATINPYRDKLNLGHTPAGTFNLIELCFSMEEKCPGIGTPLACSSAAYKAAAAMGGPQYWRARITRADGNVDFRCVIARSPPSKIATAIPRTARWHFLDQDDIVWEWCPSGCCEEWAEK
jgi:hypothetical protein